MMDEDTKRPASFPMHRIRLALDGRDGKQGPRTFVGGWWRELLRAAEQADWGGTIYGGGETVLHRECTQGGRFQVRPLTAGQLPWWKQVALTHALSQDQMSLFVSSDFSWSGPSVCPTLLAIEDPGIFDGPAGPRAMYYWMRTCLARRHVERAKAIVTPSAYTKSLIAQALHLAPESISVIPPSIGPEFGPKEPSPGLLDRYGVRPGYLLANGDYKAESNMPQLVEAYSRLPVSLRAHCPLVLAGPLNAYADALARTVGTLGLSDQVRFLGPVDEADWPDLYAGAALVVMPSRSEPTGRAALETLACGRPLVGSTLGAIPEVVGAAALLVEPHDVAAMTQAMERLLSDEDLRARLRAEGQRQVAHYSVERITERVVTLIEAVCATTPESQRATPPIRNAQHGRFAYLSARPSRL